MKEEVVKEETKESGEEQINGDIEEVINTEIKEGRLDFWI